MLSISRSALRCSSLLLFVILTFNAQGAALVIDEASLLDVIKHDKEALYERQILVKYYIEQHRYDEADAMNSAILREHPKEQSALQLQQKIVYERQAYALLKRNNLAEPTQTPSADFYDVSKVQNREIYAALSYFKRDIAPQYHENMIRYYIANKQFDEAHHALGHGAELPKATELRLKAELADAQKVYDRAAEFYSQAYAASGTFTDALALLDIQIRQKDFGAIVLYAQLQPEHRNDPALKAYDKPVKKLETLQLTLLKTRYEKDDTFAAMQPYANTLYSINKRPEAIAVASDFQQRHPDDESTLFLTRLYSWNGNYTRALEVLNAQPEPRSSASTLLLGTLYSRTEQFDKAKKTLEKVVDDSDEAIAFDAKKQLAYLWLWEGSQTKAEFEFEALLSIKEDSDIRNTLTYLAYSDAEKIAYFEKQLAKDPNDKTARITLAQLYLKKSKTKSKGIALLQENAAASRESADYLLLAQNAYWVNEDTAALAAIATILAKEPKNTKALLLKRKIDVRAADTFYFAGDYSAALSKYAALQKEAPLDKETRLHQALSLEYDHQYRRAQEEFSAIYQYDKRDYILFHLAFNTMENEEYLEAKRDFETILTHETKSSEDPAIYKLSKENIAFIDATLNAPKPVVLANGLVMAPLVEKDLLGDEEVFASSTAEGVGGEKLQALRAQPRFNKASLLLEYYRNRDQIQFYAVTAAYERKHLYKRWGMGANVGYFSIYSPDAALGTQHGTRIGVTISDEHLSLHLGVNRYEEFSELTPAVTYQNRYGELSYVLEYAYQNAMFYTMSPQALAAQISTNHFAASGYYYGSERWNVWSSIALNLYSNSNTALIPQFDYNFYRFIFSDTFSVATSLNGWYMFNSRPNTDYYSPKSYDSTLVGLRPTWIANQYMTLNLILDAGYSFTDDAPLYNFGFNLSMEEKKGLRYQLGCRESNAARNASSLTTIDYYELECTGLLEYSWH